MSQNLGKTSLPPQIFLIGTPMTWYGQVRNMIIKEIVAQFFGNSTSIKDF